ncbi:unnamed protein product [Microthlaspi erraticum]|uniref:Uncharacterized protein n=1 Tax=Microthlaspi erraticum TaxID=1685480 RepID=A0A6D2K2D9_9BRAS|nr:unnamed protein product [Microthlaspi erraticum]
MEEVAKELDQEAVGEFEAKEQLVPEEALTIPTGPVTSPTLGIKKQVDLSVLFFPAKVLSLWVFLGTMADGKEDEEDSNKSLSESLLEQSRSS